MKRALAAGLVVVALGLASGEASAFTLKKKPTPPEFAVTPDRLAEIQAALNEQRLVDAGRMIDQALIMGAKDPMLQIFSGELALGRARYDDALRAFRQVEGDGAIKARAQQGQGLALSLLGRSDEAMAVLQQAVNADAGAWRAWNALGGEYDRRRDFAKADAAYDKALVASNGAAIVYNNRGFSRVLQNRLDEAIADLVLALEKKPDLAPARTNLRLAMGLKGDYDRALAGGPQEDKAALLNNVGYAAMLRGDHAQAQELFNKAISAKGQFYTRASDNLEMVAGLKDRSDKDTGGLNGNR